MSYCRWSSDAFRSDVYCYEDCNGGYTIHVARMRHEHPCETRIDMSSPESKMESLVKQREELNKSTLVKINLPYDGETYNEPTIDLCIDRLLELREAGYYVPQSAIDRLEEELKENNE